MDHGPNIKYEEQEEVVKYKTKLGLWLFAAYAIVYFTYVLLNALAPQIMNVRVVFGLNLAVFFGFMLIIVAIVLGLIYNSLCTKKESAAEPVNNEKTSEEGDEK